MKKERKTPGDNKNGKKPNKSSAQRAAGSERE